MKIRDPLTGRWIKVGDKCEPLDQWHTGLKILNVLTQFPWVFSVNELIERVWDDPDQEPERAAFTIWKIVHDMNSKLFPDHYPWLRIVSRGRRYRLVIRRPQYS